MESAKITPVPENSAESTSQTKMTGQESKKATAVASKSRVIHYPFWFGGTASSMAACVTHPLDLCTLSLYKGPVVAGSLLRPSSYSYV